MNLLATMLPNRVGMPMAAMAGGEHPAAPSISLGDLVAADLVRGLPDELSWHEVGTQAHLKTVPWADWVQRFASIPRMSERQFDQLAVWSLAVRTGDDAVLMPADRSEAPTVQLYTRFAGRPARLILSGVRADDAFAVSGVAVDSPRHCELSACGAAEPCSGTCAGCTCGSFLDQGTHITACYCPDHGTF